jgi:hypothetical protein
MAVKHFLVVFSFSKHVHKLFLELLPFINDFDFLKQQVISKQSSSFHGERGCLMQELQHDEALRREQKAALERQRQAQLLQQRARVWCLLQLHPGWCKFMPKLCMPFSK